MLGFASFGQDAFEFKYNMTISPDYEIYTGQDITLLFDHKNEILTITMNDQPIQVYKVIYWEIDNDDDLYIFAQRKGYIHVLINAGSCVIGGGDEPTDIDHMISFMIE